MNQRKSSPIPLYKNTLSFSFLFFPSNSTPTPFLSPEFLLDGVFSRLLYLFRLKRRRMRKRIILIIRKLLSCTDSSGPHITSHPIGVDVREEYANAFRTESYIDFWTRVLALNDGEPTAQLPVETSTAARLPSYRLFAEHLLDPDQPTIKKILASAHHRPNYYSLLSDYFSHTANASLLCGRLLKDIDNIRLKYRPLKITLQSLKSTEIYSDCHYEPVLTRLVEFSNARNPFVPSARRVRIVQNTCSELLKQLELSRDGARAKLRRVRYFNRGSAGFLVAITASLTVIVVTHGIALVVATPGLLVASAELAKPRKLVKEVAQLDAAAKGTYTLNRDMDTIGRLVARLNHELEHMRVMTRFWLERSGDRRQAVSEVARQLKQSYAGFNQQLDELEEHLYLCFMTINRARNLVVKEILDPGRPVKAPYIL